MDAEAELDGFVAKFTPPMQERIRAARAWMRHPFPAAVELVYDNVNFFVIGYGPTARTSEAIYSLAAQRSGLRLCFVQRGPELPDPHRLPHGTGTVVRNVDLPDLEALDRPEVRALVDAALTLAAVPMDAATGPELIIRSISAKQRPRR